MANPIPAFERMSLTAQHGAVLLTKALSLGVTLPDVRRLHAAELAFAQAGKPPRATPSVHAQTLLDRLRRSEPAPCLCA